MQREKLHQPTCSVFSKGNVMTRQERNKQYYLKNREKLLAAQKARDLLRVEEKREYNHKYHVENKDELDVKKREYRKSKADHIKLKNREWYEKNRDYAIVRSKEYRDANKSQINRKSAAYKLDREASDPLFKLKRRLRSLIYIKLRQGSYTKKSKTFEILGCEYDQFLEHISSKFSDGMSWENHGDWHLDHIVPVAIAKTEEETIRLNHYTNFQPLWATDNLRKGATYD